MGSSDDFLWMEICRGGGDTNNVLIGRKTTFYQAISPPYMELHLAFPS